MSSGIRKQKKTYSRPMRLFDKERIEEENKFMEKYGLKNKREIWKMEFAVNKIRNQAKSLITAKPEEQEAFIARLSKKGLAKSNAKIDDVLGMTKENFVERRLQTLVLKKAFAHTAKEARQFITHRKISVDGRIINIPSYPVTVEEEKKISMKPAKQKPEVKASVITAPAEPSEGGTA